MYLYAVVFGIVTGLLVSLTLQMYSKRTTDEYTRLIFGVSSMTIIKNMLVFNILLLTVIFGWLCLFIRDVKFPSEHPLLFLWETFLVGLLPASTVFIVYYLRHIPLGKEGFYGFLVLILKCMLAHVLFQVSGVYTSLLK